MLYFSLTIRTRGVTMFSDLNTDNDASLPSRTTNYQTISKNTYRTYEQGKNLFDALEALQKRLKIGAIHSVAECTEISAVEYGNWLHQNTPHEVRQNCAERYNPRRTVEARLSKPANNHGFTLFDHEIGRESALLAAHAATAKGMEEYKKGRSAKCVGTAIVKQCDDLTATGKALFLKFFCQGWEKQRSKVCKPRKSRKKIVA